MDATVDRGTAGLTRRLAEFAAGFTLADAPAQVLDNAKCAILDCLGVAMLATGQEIGTALKDFAVRNAAGGPCTVWGTSLRVSARDAALINGTLAHGLDYDDRNHSSTYSLAAPLALAEANELTSERLLEAFIVGREVRNCLDAMFASRGSGIGPGAKGWHSNGVLGPIASAAAAARVLGLDAKPVLAAIGLATGSCGALTRDGGTMAKPFRTGHAAATGITCVALAMSGFSSDDMALEGRYGYLEALGPLPEEITNTLARELGRTFNLAKPIRGKRYASCSASHGGLEAMLRLVRRESVTPDRVESIACDLKPYPLVREKPGRGYEGRFSMPFCLALALAHGDVRPGDFIDANVADPVIRDLMAKVRHQKGDVLTVTLKDGRRLEEPLAHPTDFTSWEEIAGKFQDCTRGILSAAQSEGVVDFVATLDEGRPIGELSGHLRAAP